MTFEPQYLKAKTMHARKGGIENKFIYPVDCVLIDPESAQKTKGFARNSFHIFSVNDRDFGPKDINENPIVWIRQQFEKARLSKFQIRLLTQPRLLGTLFNPVSFWLAYKDDVLVAFIAEVNNTFKQRHFYLCHHADFREISSDDKLSAKKVFYVSPFQKIEGNYVFQIHISDEKFAIYIDFQNGSEGVLATIYGARSPLKFSAIIGSAFRRPFGGMRVMALIFYQAMKLKFKGAKYRTRPNPPKIKVSS